MRGPRTDTPLTTRAQPIKPVRTARFGYGLPGAVSWGLTALVAAGTLLWRPWTYIVLAFVAYFLARMAWTLVYDLAGEVQLRRWKRLDHTRSFDKHGPFGFAPSDVHHVVVVPCYREPSEILSRTLDAMARQFRASDRMVVILGMEEREPEAKAKAEKLCASYRDRFASMTFTLHPANLSGEAAGKSSNEAWAARAVPDLISALGVRPDLVTITSCDADSVFHDRYFAAVAQLFAADENRHRRFWQAPLFFYNNIWRVPAPVRLTTWMAHALQLAELACGWYRPLPISTYTMSMPLAMASGWWDPAIISEDWHTFLTAQFAKQGDVRLIPVMLPTYGDATDGETWWGGIRSRHMQLTRHSWGAEDVGWIVAQMSARPETRRPWAYWRLLQVAHDHIARTASWLLLTNAWVLTLLPAVAPWLAPERWQLRMLQVGMSAAGILMVATIAIDLARHRPEGQSWFRVGAELIALWLTLPLIGFYLSALPGIVAQTKLLFRLPFSYRLTPKRLHH